MPKARLREVRLEFHGHTVYGKVDNRGRLDLHICTHEMQGDDREDARKIVAWLKAQGNDARNPRKCDECSKCYMGCLNVGRRPLHDSLDNLMQAVRDAIDEFGGKVELTFAVADKLYTFSTKTGYIGGSILSGPGYYCLEDVWTYFIKSPVDVQLIRTIESIPGVHRVGVEPIPDTGRAALDIRIPYSRELSLETRLAAITEKLAS